MLLVKMTPAINIKLDKYFWVVKMVIEKQGSLSKGRKIPLVYTIIMEWRDFLKKVPA